MYNLHTPDLHPVGHIVCEKMATNGNCMVAIKIVYFNIKWFIIILDELTIDNVQDALWDVRARWKNIGYRLGIDPGTLEALEVPGNHDESFTKMMNHWLSGEYDPEEPNSKPRTWCTLIGVLRSRVVNAKKLATKLEMEKCPKGTYLIIV